MRALLATALVLSGCNFATVTDHAIDDVASLQLLPSGDVEACATYVHEEDVPTECCSYQIRNRVVRVDARGAISDETKACTGAAQVLAAAPLSDGGTLSFADSNLARLDASGATLWTVPSPFGHISAASADAGGYVYLARGPQVARLALADGGVEWISELR